MNNLSQIKSRTKRRVRIISLFFAFAIASAGWIYLYLWDWKVAGSVMLVMWANNINNKHP